VSDDSGEERARWKTVLEAAVWIAVLAYAGYQLWPQVGAALGVGGERRPAPSEVTVTTFEGERVRLGQLRGRVVLVNFWATWCPPCRLEMPGFQDVYEEYRDRGFTILGLTTESAPRAEIQSFLDEHGVTYPVARASAEDERAFGGVTALPTSFLVDRRGRIRHTVRGFFAEAALRRAVGRLLEEDTGERAAGHAPPGRAP